MKVLALDFDGVISDSGPEAFVVALRTYEALRPAGGLAAPSEVSLSAISASSLYRAFVDVMPLGNRAEDFAVGLAALAEGEALPGQAAYHAFKQKTLREAPHFLEDFHSRFYTERDAFAENDSTGWYALLGPYPAFVELLRRPHPGVQLAIATAKDRPAVERLLVHYGIADLFDPNLVLDKETGVSKRAHLEALCARSGVGYEAITFVDDKVSHLEAVAELGVRCALAAWGYNSTREHEQAAELGYLVCDLDNAEALLFGAC